MMASLEQERIKQAGANQEILTILNKLEKQFKEKFSTSNILIESEGSIDSLLDESCSINLRSMNETPDLNCTWPQKSIVTPSRRLSYDSIASNKLRTKENIEYTKSVICSLLKDLKNVEQTSLYEERNPSFEPMSIHDIGDNYTDLLQSGESAHSPIMSHRLKLPERQRSPSSQQYSKLNEEVGFNRFWVYR